MEAVYYAARANLRRLMRLYPRLPTAALCSSGRHVAGLGQEMEETPAGGSTGGRAGAAQSLAGAQTSARAYQPSRD
jgi:hypothetical protein